MHLSQYGCNSKTTDCRVNRDEIWGSGVIVVLIPGTFDPFSVQGHFGIIRCTCLNMAVTRKWVAVERND